MERGRERRCPRCGALAGPDAEWCGQCFTSLIAPPSRPPEPEMPAPSEAGSAAEAPSAKPPDELRRTPMWTCPVCEAENPIEEDLCAVCGTPFARLLREPEERPDVAPRSALLWSLAFPGLGHWRLRRGLEALSRGVLFAWALVITLLLLAIRTNGPTAVLLVLFAIVAVLFYVLTAFEAYRMALGWPPLVPARALLWGSAGLVAVSAFLIGIAVATASSRGK